MNKKFYKKNLKKILKNKLWTFSLAILLIINIYWGFVATERFVSSTTIVLQSSEIAPPELSFSSMLSGSSASDTADLLLLREYLLSVDMLKILDEKLNLRAHFSNSRIDYFSRLSVSDLPIEYFHEYYLKRVNIYIDDYSKVLKIEVSAFNKDVAVEIAELLLKFGEIKMNHMGQRLAEEQVAFIEKQVVLLNQRLESSRNAVLQYQDEQQMISPTTEVEALGELIIELRIELTKLSAKYAVLKEYQSAQSPQVIQLKNEIGALKQQIQINSEKLTSERGNALNKKTAEYETLLLRAQFAQELYSNALVTLETARVEAARQLKQVSVIQKPTLPEYALAPDRLYNIVVITILGLLVTLIMNMILLIIRDHKD